MQAAILYPNPANRAVRAFKTAFSGMPAIYWAFSVPAFAIHPIWLSIPFALSGMARLARLGIRTARLCAGAGVRMMRARL